MGKPKSVDSKSCLASGDVNASIFDSIWQRSTELCVSHHLSTPDRSSFWALSCVLHLPQTFHLLWNVDISRCREANQIWESKNSASLSRGTFPGNEVLSWALADLIRYQTQTFEHRKAACTASRHMPGVVLSGIWGPTRSSSEFSLRLPASKLGTDLSVSCNTSPWHSAPVWGQWYSEALNFLQFVQDRLGCWETASQSRELCPSWQQLTCSLKGHGHRRKLWISARVDAGRLTNSDNYCSRAFAIHLQSSNCLPGFLGSHAWKLTESSGQVISLLLAALYPAFAPNTGMELGQLDPAAAVVTLLLRLWLVSTRLARSLISKWLDGALQALPETPCCPRRFKDWMRMVESLLGNVEDRWVMCGTATASMHLWYLVQDSWGLELLEGALKLLEARTLKMAMIHWMCCCKNSFGLLILCQKLPDGQVHPLAVSQSKRRCQI